MTQREAVCSPLAAEEAATALGGGEGQNGTRQILGKGPRLTERKGRRSFRLAAVETRSNRTTREGAAGKISGTSKGKDGED